MKKNEEIVYLKLDQIKPYEKNARINDAAVGKVAKSIEEFGFKVPIIIDKDNVIIAGHTRYKACLQLGIDEVPCIIAKDLSEAKVKAFRIAENKTNELADWDFDLLSDEIDELANMDYDINLLGFNDAEIDEITKKSIEDMNYYLDLRDGYAEPKEEPVEVEEDDFDVEDAIPEEPKSKIGDIYQLGNHRLMCGDSTDIDSIKMLLDGNDIHMLYTDPPYGMNLDTDFSGMKNKLDFAKDKGFKNGKKYESGFVDDFSPKMIDVIFKLNIKETFLWGADYFAEFLENKNDGSWIVWDKRANGNDDVKQDYQSDKMYGSCFELCWSKQKHKRDIARVKWAGVFGTEQEFDHKRHHPTQKPIKLSTWFIERYSKENENVLDLFGGSGSTIIACEQSDRNCFMMELDPKYVDVIINRWEQLTGETAEKISEL